MLSLLASGQDAQDTTAIDTAYLREQTEALAATTKRAGGFIWKKSRERKKKNHLTNQLQRLRKRRLKL
jgi:hypothetical protein